MICTIQIHVEYEQSSKALFRSAKDEKFTLSLLSPESLPFISSVVFHILFLLKKSENPEAVLSNLHLLSQIFTNPNLVRSSNLILGAIFPGVLSALIETMKTRKNSRILKKTFQLYVDLIIVFLIAEPVEARVFIGNFRLRFKFTAVFPNLVIDVVPFALPPAAANHKGVFS